MSRAKARAAAPASAPAGKSRAPQALLAAGLGALLALYLALPDKVFVFDGVMFAAIIERGVDEWRSELLNRRHLLFNPALMGVRDALAWLRMPVAGYALIQRVNAVAAVAGLALYAGLLRRLRLDRAICAAGALLLGGTFAYASRATEGQVYMIMTVLALAVLGVSLDVAARPTPAKACALGLVAAAAVLFHAANAALAVPCAAALLIAYRGSRDARVWWAAPLAAALVAAPYALCFRLDSWRALMSFLGTASELQFYGSTTAAGLAGGLLRSGGLGPATRAAVTLAEFAGAFACLSWPAPALAAAGAAVFATAAFAARRAWSRREDRPAVAVLLAAAASSAGLNAFWRGGLFFWGLPCACMIALALLAWGRDARPRAVMGLAAAAGLLAAWNAWAGLWPQSRLENNVGYQRTKFVRDHTVGSSWILISGLGYPNAKVYLPYFAHRSREVLEYYLNRGPKAEALRKFGAFVESNERNGIPLYLLPDLVDDREALAALRDTWGVTPADLQAVFGPGDLLKVAAMDERFKVYLFVPQRGIDRLFAVLSYSALVENEPQRLAETAGALRVIASRMSAAQRAAAVKTLAETDYGVLLLLAGFSPYMNPESQAAAARRVELFHQTQKTGDFHLRLGNLYKYLQRLDLARKEWQEAYRLSGDKAVLRQLRTN